MNTSSMWWALAVSSAKWRCSIPRRAQPPRALERMGVHVLRLNGDAFRDVLNANPTIASGIIRTLAQRLRSAVQIQHAVTAS